MTETKGFTDEIRALIGHVALGSFSLEELDVILTRISMHTDMPLRPYGTHPVPDSKLNISSNQVQLGDGTTQSTGLNVDGIINNLPLTTIDFQTGATTPIGSVLREGAAFTLPNGTLGQYYRMALVYQALDNHIDTIFSGASGSVAALENPALLFDALQYDSLVGWIDLECTDGTIGASKYKTADSVGLIIENEVGGISRIARFGAGSGEGITGDTSFNVQKIAGNVASMKKGFIILDDNTELTTYDGVELNENIDFNLKTEINTEGVTAPANNTRYYLYIDRTYLPAAPVDYGATDRKVFAVQGGTSGPLVVLIETPQQLTGERYIPLASLKTDGSGNYLEFSNTARRRHQVASQAVSPLVHTVEKQVVGNVGDAGQLMAAHILDVGSFPFTLAGKGYFWNLDDVVDGSGNGINLINTGTIGFSDTDQFGNASNAAELDGATKYLSSSNAALNPGNVAMAMFGWFKAASWNPATEEALLSLGSGGTDWAAEVLIGAGGIKFQMSSDGTAIAASGSYNGYFTAGSWHHVAMLHNLVTNEMWGFVDGIHVTTVALPSGLHALSSPLFSVGAKYGTAFLSGSARDVGFINNQAVNELDIMKLYSAKVTFELIEVSDQKWTAQYSRADNQITNDMNSEWIVDRRAQDLYFYLGLEPTDSIELRLYDGGSYTYTIPKRGFSRIYRVDPSGTIPHRVGSTPANLVVLHDTNADGNWIPQNAKDHLKANPTDLTFAINGLTIDSTHPVWILASAGQEVLSVPPEEPWLPVSGAYTAKTNDRLLVDSSGGPLNITLPSPVIGDSLQIMDHMGTFDSDNVTLLRNGKKIQNILDDMDLNQKDKLYTIVFSGDTYGWRVV